MAIRNIVYDDNPLLTKKSKKVESFDESLWQLLDDMKETMEMHDGVGIAAVQVGVLKRAAIISINNMFFEIINPQILESEGSQSTVEGCLSIKNILGYVTRPEVLTVQAQDRYGNDFVITGIGQLAVVMAHEIDHLDGVLFTSKMTKPYIENSENPSNNKENKNK